MKNTGLAGIALLTTLVSFAMAQPGQQNATLPLSSIVTRMEAVQAHWRDRAAYQAVREYRLTGSRNSDSDSRVIAQVDFVPPGEHSYRIQNSTGNGHGEQVVRRILDQEVQARDDQARGAAVNQDNYDFSYLGEAQVDGHACYRLGLTPKRKAKDLVAGEALVDQKTFQVRQVEGDLAKTPSWWLKKVHVKMAFASVQGTWVQTNMEAVADVRIFGQHTLTSQLVDFRGADVVAMRTNANARSARSRDRRSRKADPAYSAVFTR
jgi:hypothetical protein